ncbi:L-histidine N(alpha)-methyltransferase [Segetibacter sp. 3557_3]|uniref:L-histidine N(alpha)-methyltransferase n=1 Tax=Segetibacter sp. 3557_3 TaxID=2547429 RepID=UPI0010585DE4|nr:L-histidine N(alpha)-methyltransferase [Segetibacter sp. 3557_3]TDH25147.1 L-histidine N(alpha)-methyltransferase [Segetibacter sp. 3557_3]
MEQLTATSKTLSECTPEAGRLSTGPGKVRLTADSPFLQSVLKGLCSKSKFLESKYFYDEAGDELFRQIMACPEYYPTDCEHEIFSRQTAYLASALIPDSEDFDVIELGAGDATKSIFLLSEILGRNQKFTYLPVDISSNVINNLQTQLPARLPGLRVTGLNGEYFQMLAKATERPAKRKIVLFLGGNIGNIPYEEARQFCLKMREHLAKGDLVLIGFDLKKDPRVILSAYNDKAGLTRDFNLNLLKRINRELGANFNLDNFSHYPTYDPANGACKSYLVCNISQEVNIAGETIRFRQGETVFMEISQKYTPDQTDELAHQCGFRRSAHFYDSRQWFLDAVWECI